jgi:penicillin-binding protein 2
MLVKSENNHVRIQDIEALRGVIFDRNGKKVVENVSSMNVYINIESYLEADGALDNLKIEEVSYTLEGILEGDWKKENEAGEDYLSISEKIYAVHKSSPYFTEILIATDIDNDTAIELKAQSEELLGVHTDDGSKRNYVINTSMSHLLGYTGEVSATDLERLDYVDSTDIVGKSGLEREYDERLNGIDGKKAWEVDAFGKTISDDEYILQEPVEGENLYLTIDSDIQSKLYEILSDATKEYGASGAAAVIEDVETGEIISLVTYPSYDNNLFVGGISYKNYAKLLEDEMNPLLNRTISAQIPPGSTFKTLVAIGALDSGAINKSTIYVSRAGYSFSSGALFQEYRNHVYGRLNVVDALAVSSNIFFCETIRNWDMNELVPYLEAFGIGELTGIDLPGETAGRLPSPANKIYLANTTSPWLDAVWYPEGDSCNSVIGQGITLVTPLQMANWMAAIANGGTLNTPHLAKKFINEEGDEDILEYEPIATDLASSNALNITKEGMRAAVLREGSGLSLLSGYSFSVAAKTGTAEFGALNEKGVYEHTHAWVGGFFPYESPKYSFSILLEDGGESYNAVKTARIFFDWLVENEYF